MEEHRDGTVDASPQALAQLKSVAPVALLTGSVRLEPDLMGVDHDQLEPERSQLTRHEERDRPGLEREPAPGLRPGIRRVAEGNLTPPPSQNRT